jgi:toxin ParE1/3/4
VKLRYTLRGAAELDEVLGDLAQKSPQGARNVQMRIREIINLLLRHPYAGNSLARAA